MNTSDFKDYKVDHLFLLIGENPLPNYVVARLLLNEQGGTPYLVHTTDTEEQAKRLATILGNELPSFKAAQLVSLNDYESDAHYIRKTIRHHLKTIEGKLGLNYTGGTKAMAVHAYQELFSKERPDTIFSYLDPRKLEMCIDQEDDERIRRKVKPEVLPVELGKVFQIHGWAWLEKSKPIYQPELPEAAQALAKAHSDEELIKLWRTWCNKVLREAARKPNDKNKWLKENQLKGVSDLSLKVQVEDESVDLSKISDFQEVLNQLGIQGESLSLRTVQEQGLESLESTCKWLDGEWLEHYVLQQVQKNSQEWSINDSATSFWIRDPSSPKDTKFQFDVAFMRGYQLFAIYCTTIDRKFDCKSKLFEAYIRAQQLGGSEARVALVCCVSPKDANALETEIVNVLKPEPGSAKKDNKVAVFGRDDLIGLSDKIAEWIRNNEREAQ